MKAVLAAMGRWMYGSIRVGWTIFSSTALELRHHLAFGRLGRKPCTESPRASRYGDMMPHRAKAQRAKHRAKARCFGFGGASEALSPTRNLSLDQALGAATVAVKLSSWPRCVALPQGRARAGGPASMEPDGQGG